ncbi:MarR family winged helix-turn-helix transcriptional regulator [Sinomonas sp. G460-2]|uniref:MarR family winged helix-turn-helix transcriptional regulator n=1 Tax=Sinomonas sp. G460-2 TaxID=3393464 RepID=UPI0039EDF105
MDYERAHALNRAIRTIGMRHRALAGSFLQRVGLTVGQESLIMDLAEHGPRTQSQLAAAAGCEPPTITSAVRRLESLGLVARAPSELDRRATVVELTESGRGLLPDLSTVWIELAEASVAGLARTSADDLVRALADLAESLSAAADRTGPGTAPAQRGTAHSDPRDPRGHRDGE